MFDFSNAIDLPLIWGMLIAVGIFLYVLLDGFDLGVGILFPLAPSNKSRDIMMNSIAPFWDGNETWLVLGGGGLLAAFPLAYAILMPAFYIPITLMLFGLIMRGVAFEFRYKSDGLQKQVWSFVFHYGSLCAAFFQGAILGAFIEGIEVEGRNFTGGPFDWATGFSVMTGIAVCFGYTLLGATWLVMKTEGKFQDWARRIGLYALSFVALFMGIVSFIMPLINERVMNTWFSQPNIYYLSVVPVVTLALFVMLARDLYQGTQEYRPFFLSIGLFVMGYAGLAISIFPYIIPFQYTVYDAAASGPGLSLMLVGVLPMLPIILGYTAYCYYVFRGKTSHEHEY